MHDFLGLGIGIGRFILILICFYFVVKLDLKKDLKNTIKKIKINSNLIICHILTLCPVNIFAITI